MYAVCACVRVRVVCVYTYTHTPLFLGENPWVVSDPQVWGSGKGKNEA